MTEETATGNTLIIRAWRDADGVISARVTHGVEGAEPALEISKAESDSEVIALVRVWLDRIGPAGNRGSLDPGP